MLTVEKLKNYYSSDIVLAWNTYCENNYYYNSIFYSIDLLNTMLSEKSPRDLIRLCEGNYVSVKDDYFRFNDRDLKTYNFTNVKKAIDLDDLVAYINENSYMFEKIFEDDLEDDIYE